MKTNTDRSKWGTLLSCSLSCFVVWLDYAIVNTALPAIEHELSATLLQLQWIINAFVLAICVFIIPLGRLSDQYGRKLMNTIGVSCFGLFSLLAGIASSPDMLIFCRLIQGIACSAITPTALAMISHAYPGKEKGKAIGIWSAISAFGMAVGPAAGGFIVSALSWRWIFYLNIPFAVGSVILTLLFAKESRSTDTGLKIDWKGLILMTAGLGSLVFSLMHGPDWGWLNEKTLLLALASLLILAWFYRSETKSASPLIPFGLVFNRAFFFPLLTMFGLVFVFSSAIFLIPLYLIQVRGQEAYEAGFMILSITASMSLLSPFVGHLMAKIPAKRLILTGLFLFGVSTVFQAFFTTHTSLFIVLVSLILMGIGWGIARTPATTTALASAPHQYAGTATGVLWSIQNSGGVLSIAIVMTLFRTIFQTNSTPESFMAGYEFAMWLLSAVTFAVLVTIALYMKSALPDK